MAFFKGYAALPVREIVWPSLAFIFRWVNFGIQIRKEAAGLIRPEGRGKLPEPPVPKAATRRESPSAKRKN